MSKPLARALHGLLLGALPMLLCCSDGGSDKAGPDSGLRPDGVRHPDSSTPSPDSGTAATFKIAAIQYGKGEYAVAPGCAADVCALAHLARQAAQAGAKLVVMPEYSIYQETPWDPPPAVGETPAVDAGWSKTRVVRPFAELAAEEKIYIAFNLKTQEEVGGETRKYNTSVAVDPTGEVVGVHHKYELFSDFEKTTFTAGDSIEDSLFDTPAGRAGMLICADIHCIITGLQTGVDGRCTAAGASMVKQFAAGKPRLVLVSNYWFKPADTPVWGSIVVGATVAKSMQAYVATANTTKTNGFGGAIYDPTGAILAKGLTFEPSVTYAEIPLPGK